MNNVRQASGTPSVAWFQCDNENTAMTSSISIYDATNEEVSSGELGLKLRQFNYQHVGEYPQQQYIRLNAKDAEGNLAGGVRGHVFLYWLRIEVLWVAESLRGGGLGTRLLEETESRARALGATNAALETFEWQAPGFYRKRGYEEFARIDDYARGFYLAQMRKRL